MTITVELRDASPTHQRELHSLFEPFAWRPAGPGIFRYERSETQGKPGVADWRNQVVPALTLLRSYALEKTLELGGFTIDVGQDRSGSWCFVTLYLSPRPGDKGRS
jgi:hypothetical protein